jgi:Skp family chaperone for outer membrane proteins
MEPSEQHLSAMRAHLTAIEDELCHQARDLEKLRERLEYEHAHKSSQKQISLTSNLIAHRQAKLKGVGQSRASLLEKLQRAEKPVAL